MSMFADLKKTRNILRKKQNPLLRFLLIFISISVLFLATTIKAQVTEITDIIIKGNQRIQSETILSLSELTKNNTFTETQLNQALLRLNASTFFKSAIIKLEKNKIIIMVKEYPTINSINFEGNNSLDDNKLLDLISTAERKTFSPSKIEQDAENIAKAYSTSGRLDAQVTPKIIEISDNRIDLVFEINEGRVTEIEKITFTGNRIYSEKRLRGIIATKQAGLFRTFMKSDTFIEDRIDYDIELLRDFYSNNGFINFKTTSTSAELTRQKDAFLINYSIEEGQKYKYGKIIILSTDENINLSKLNKLIKIKEDSTYDLRKLNKLVEEIEISLSKSGTNFINVSPRLLIDNENLKIDIEIDLLKANKIFVERIEISGNSTTLDEVIRLKFDFVEGDPFNIRKIQEASDRIRAVGFFSEVNVTTKEGSSPDQIIIDVALTEKATGSLGLGAGYNSSDGTVFTFNINERNFLGKGQTVDLALSSSTSERQ